MYIDVKIEVWQRISLSPSVTLDWIKLMLATNTINALFDEKNAEATYENLVETEHYLTPEENDYEPTIEIYDDDKTLVWNNDPRLPRQQLQPTYVLFGSEATRCYFYEGYEEVVKLCKEGKLECSLEKFEPNCHVSDILSVSDGWDGYAIITEEEYNSLYSF